MGTSRTFDVRGRAAEATSRRIVEEALDTGANLFDSSTIRRLVASAARPRTSKVREVPMPTTGTSNPSGPSVR
ncbi:MAG TPA: hypothetical protein VG795_04505, partial [Acidimicrobiia bacterium]|nr:hypothetical protein [Acidimicrobiia bacterium]